MIIIEQISNQCERRYSDADVKLRQIETGTLWNDAVDVIPCRFTYEETDIPVDDVELEPEEALAILLGRDGDEEEESA